MIDGANLSLDTETLDSALETDGAIVAVPADATTVLGALVLDGERIVAVAVRPGRRGQGIGTSLVAVAADRRSQLVAEFDPPLEPFWRSVGFDVVHRGDGRFLGVR